MSFRERTGRQLDDAAGDAHLVSAEPEIVEKLSAARERAVREGDLHLWHEDLKEEIVRTLSTAGAPAEQVQRVLAEDLDGRLNPGERIEGLAYLVRLAGRSGDLAQVAHRFVRFGEDE